VLVRREVLRRIEVEADQIAARQIQGRLLPAELPTAPGFELAVYYSPFREIGGDFYDVVPLDEHRWLIVMADVSGKGTAAALLTASLQALVHFASGNEPSLAAAASAINRHLVRFAPPGRFITMVLGVLDIERRRLRYVNAGHNPPIGVTAQGDVLRLAATGLPIGILEPSAYTEEEIELPRGTTCLFYTDGLTERANRADDLFGEERLVTVLRGLTDGLSAHDVVDAVVAESSRFARGVEPGDDTALLVVRSR
jgi:sigma-B regulation protein RsbU (phosphoserine phosphatase)